jgi:hypothetical protein
MYTLGNGAECANCGEKSPSKFCRMNRWMVWACGVSCADQATVNKLKEIMEGN